MFKRDHVHISDTNSDEDDDTVEPIYFKPRSSTKHFNSEIPEINPNKIIYDKYIAEGKQFKVDSFIYNSSLFFCNALNI